MLTSSGVIIVPTKGQVMPKAYLDRVVGKFTSFMGAATVIADTGNKPEFMLSGDTSLPSVEDFLKLLEEDKNNPMMIYYAQLNGGSLTTESEQPFVMLRSVETDEPIIVGCIEGEYANNSNTDSAHTDEYHAAEKVAAYLRKFYKLHGCELEKLEAELAEGDLATMFNSLCINRGVISLLTINGNAFHYQKGNELGGEYPWGFVSNKIGFEEKSSKDVSTTEKKQPTAAAKQSLLDRMRGKKPSVQIADTESIAEKKAKAEAASIAKANAGSVIENKVVEPPVQDTAVKDPIYIKPPEDILTKGWNRIKGWYEAHTDWTGLTEKQMKAGNAAPANDKWIAKHAGKFKPMKEGLKDMREAVETSQGQPQKYKAFAPIISPDARKKLNELLDSKAITAITEASVTLDPEALKSSARAAPWSAQMGRSLEEVFRWDDEVYQKFLDKNVEIKDFTGARLLFREMRDQLMAFLVEEKPAAEEETTDETAPAKETKPASGKKGSLIDRFKKAAA